MKILLVHNQYQKTGGEDIVLSSEKKILISRGHKTALFLRNNKNIYSVLSKIKTAFESKYSMNAKNALSEKIKAFDPDIVHIHNFFPILTPSIYDACIENKKPVVQTLHNYRIICPGALLMRDGKICEKCIFGNFYWAAIHRCYRRSFWSSTAVVRMLRHHRKTQTWCKKIDQYIVLTNFAKNKFIQSGFPPKKITIKPNFYEDKQKKQSNSHTNHGSALFVGRMSHEKGVFTLLEAWKQIDIHLTMAGDGPMLKKLKNLNTTNVSFIGHISPKEISKKMGEADFLIMPSEWYETFGLVIIEAFAHHLPVIASKIGSMAEIIKDNETGLLFEPGNSKELAEKVLWMHNHPDECKKMGENARNVYEKKYTAEKNYKMLIDIYQKTIENYEIKNF